MRNPFRRRKRIQITENPFKNKRTLSEFLGKTAGALVAGEISHEEAHEIERLTLDFFKMLGFKDFSFEVFDGLTEPERKLPYST
jgi:S-adenosylmethionine synthetase